MKHSTLFFYLIIALIIACEQQKSDSVFSFEKTEQGVELSENGHPVFFYQKEPKSLDGEYICNNYLHPLYNLNGEIITEEFPADHPYHRGVFWAWHQIYVQGESIGDGWIMKNIEQNVTELKTSADRNSAKLKAEVLWKSPNFENGKPFISEQTSIIVHPIEDNVRKIDFTIALKALVPNVEVGGSDDEKGYGGLCIRVKLPADITFTSQNKNITPQNESVNAGPWMDFSGTFIEKSELNGVSILCHPKTPNYPAPWILRSKTSMQNIVFPGRQRIEVPVNEPLVLHYRLIIHNGGANSIELDNFQSEYENSDIKL